MRWAAALAVAAAAETLACFLSLTWGFGALILAFIFIAARASAVMAANTAKAVTTETRVNAIIPVLAAHAAGITAAQNAANGAQGTANTANAAANNAQGTANSANGTANNALSAANGCLPLSGGTITGALNINGTLWGNTGSGVLTIGSNTEIQQNLTVDSALGVHGGSTIVGPQTITGSCTVDGALGVHGGGTCVGQWSTDSLSVNGSGLSMPQPNLTLATSGNYINAINAVIGTMRNLGLI